AASQEQSKGIGQVNQAVTQMDEVTQQNAALVEQAASAASSLESQANHLKASVSMFRLDVSTDAGARRAVAQASNAAPARPCTSYASPEAAYTTARSGDASRRG
ncbi:MAG: methyl-accepting chemotaxis protein, partial [Paraburkholderia sp.]|nr:methyl-accepting chemotaxis protein [Paraburkholderia sp.]